MSPLIAQGQYSLPPLILVPLTRTETAGIHVVRSAYFSRGILLSPQRLSKSVLIICLPSFLSPLLARYCYKFSLPTGSTLHLTLEK